MPKSIFDDQKIGIPCPNCEIKIKRSVGWLRTHTYVECPNCNQGIELNNSQFKSELRKVDRSIEKLGKQLDRAFK